MMTAKEKEIELKILFKTIDRKQDLIKQHKNCIESLNLEIQKIRKEIKWVKNEN